jgi:hypothetical protein
MIKRWEVIVAMFEIIGTTNVIVCSAETKHIGDRMKRVTLVERLLVTENAKMCGAYIVNKGHKNGNEKRTNSNKSN